MSQDNGEGDRLLICLCLACIACMICYSLGMKDGKTDTNKVWLQEMKTFGRMINLHSPTTTNAIEIPLRPDPIKPSDMW